MSHKRNDSVNSNASNVTSGSSASSVETYQETIKPSIDVLNKTGISLQDLVDRAEKIIKEIFAPDPRNIYTYKKGSEEVSTKLDPVMIAMLECAEESGGEAALRYVASAIVACTEVDEVVDALKALGTTWLTHFLFIFKTSHGHRNQKNKNPSINATPTADETAGHLLEGVAGHRAQSFHDDVFVRDGYTCVMTGLQDRSHPKPSTERRPRLQVSHILRRAIGEFDSNHKSPSYKSALASFDILVNFTGLATETLEDLHEILDDPSNGITLDFHFHDTFDSFDWCLKKTEKEDVYDVKVYSDVGIAGFSYSTSVHFKDHSGDFSNDSDRKRNRPVALPNPRFIQIHSALAGILHMSGAGRFFDELLDRYKDDEGKVPPVRSFPELEAWMESGMPLVTVN